MKIKHTNTEVYRVCYYLPMNGTYKNEKRWYPYKYYSTKQSAINAIKHMKIKENNLVWRVDWLAYPLSADFITIYDESEV